MRESNDINIREEIWSKNNEKKVVFIQNVKRIEIPNSFVPHNPRSNAYEIFYGADGAKREWLYFENNNFYCAYCLCFSPCTNHRLVNGIEYTVGCRVTDALNRHEKEPHHNRAKGVYERFDSNRPKCDLGTRQIMKIIIRIIIFIATHGEHTNIICRNYI